MALTMLTGCGERARQHEFAAMSTIVRATVYHRRGPDWEAVERAAREFAAQYDHRDPASPVARLNRDGNAQLEPRLAETLRAALRLAAATGGAFDPTLLPVTRLWDFDHGGTLPEAAALAAALERVDYRRLQVDAGGRATLQDAELDLGAIGKGAVVDHLADWLAERGYERFLLEAGGDVLVSGLKPDAAPWRIWVRHPRQADLPLAIAAIGVAGGRVALATSGDYERFFEQEGVRYHHILNPATGRPDSGRRGGYGSSRQRDRSGRDRHRVICYGKRRRRAAGRLPGNRRRARLPRGRRTGGRRERRLPGAAGPGQRQLSTPGGGRRWHAHWHSRTRRVYSGARGDGACRARAAAMEATCDQTGTRKSRTRKKGKSGNRGKNHPCCGNSSRRGRSC